MMAYLEIIAFAAFCAYLIWQFTDVLDRWID